MFSELVNRLRPARTPATVSEPPAARIFAAPFASEPDSFEGMARPVFAYKPSQAALVFGPRRSSSMSTCAAHTPNALKRLFGAIHREDCEAAVELITAEPHLLYCKSARHTPLEDAIDCDSPLAALLLARTIASESTEGQHRLKRVLRHAIHESHRSNHCALLASLLHALWITEGDAWVTQLMPGAASPTPVQSTYNALRRAALSELDPVDLQREDIQDLLNHGTADLLMMGIAERMAQFDPSLRVPTHLFNRDERALLAFSQSVETLQSHVLAKTLPSGQTLDTTMERAMLLLVAQGATVLGAMNQRLGRQRTDIGESIDNLRDLFDHA